MNTVVARHHSRGGRLRIWLAGVCALAAIWASSTASAAESLRRFAILASSNDGGGERARLRFANSDAAAMARVLEGFGGVASGDLVVLTDATPATLRAGVAKVRALVAAARTRHRRIEVVLYYSGHSDEEGLLPGGELVRYDELRAMLGSLQVDVRIAILDSCASGALIRTKGGVRRPPFLFDQSGQVRGHAYLTSSSADEAAQESDRIGASYFTHHLVTGLRGAADVDRDRRVTLSEAYQYAFHATLDTTQKSRSGPQHPNYDFELAGSGDVVITDLSAAGAVLVLDRSAVGRFFVRDQGGRLVAELDKVPGRSIELGLEPGAYRVELRRDDRVWETSLTLHEGGRGVVDIGAMRPRSLVDTRARGGLSSVWARASARIPMASLADTPEHPTEVPFNLSVLPGVSLHGASRHVTQLSLGLVTGNAAVSGLDMATIGTITTGDVRALQLAGVFHIVGGGMRGTQLAGAANVVRGDVDGVQVAGALNVAGDVRGTQIAGAMNLAVGPVRGVQIAGSVNIGDDVAGVQVAVANIASHLDGIQVGMVNVAGRSDGLQVGLLNVASGKEANTFGLLSFVRDGYNHLEAWASDTTTASVGVKFGGKHMYTLLAAGYGTQHTDAWEFCLGLGGHLALTDRFWIDVDGMGGSRWTARALIAPEQEALLRLRGMVGMRVWRSVGVFVGSGLNVAFGLDGRNPRPLPLGTASSRQLGDGDNVAFGPSLFAGLQL